MHKKKENKNTDYECRPPTRGSTSGVTACVDGCSSHRAISFTGAPSAHQTLRGFLSKACKEYVIFWADLGLGLHRDRSAKPRGVCAFGVARSGGFTQQEMKKKKANHCREVN